MKRAQSTLSFAATLLATLFATASAQAARPATDLERRTEIPGVPAKPPGHFTYDLTPAEAQSQIKEIAAWDVTMQSSACVDPDAGPDGGPNACTVGGIIEVESGPGMAIVASDNTQEAIGVWNINQKLNGVAYPTNIAGAFGYLATHPGYLAWQVANDPGPADYYSVYNCGWGVRAVILYEATSGDMSHHEYGELCAQHIAMYASTLVDDSALLIDVGPAGWAASGLWLWGDTYPADAAMKTTAASIGAQVKSWIEATPSRLTYQEWAMTGAAPYYGVIESYMKENPTELEAWVTEFAPMLGGWIDESMPATPNDWTDWRNAWNGWNMAAQFTSAEVLGQTAGAMSQAAATDILTKLVAQAGPTSGAIPGSQQRPNTEAESWITAYLVYFGLLEVIAPPAVDAGTDAGTTDAAATDAAAKPEAGAKDAGTKDASARETGTAKDAGRTAVHDAAATTDAGHGSAGSSGCSCGVAGGEREAPFALAALFGGFAVLAARRRRARAS